MEPPGLKEAIAAMLRPSRTEVVRAKRLVLELLASGEVVERGELEHVLATAEGTEARPDEVIRIVTSDPAASVTANHPQIHHLRLRSAGVEAVAEIAARGMAVAVGGDLKPRGEFPFKHETREGSTLRTGTVRVDPQLPSLAPAYRLAHNLLASPPWFLDVDLFLEDLGILNLSRQLTEILDQAFVAYRHGLYLACASLLGSVSEGAWYALAEPFAGTSGALRKALDGDRTAQVQKLLADQFRNAPRAATVPDELVAHAALLREIRNFGVHPREDPPDDLTKFFTEEACALLILNTHRYLAKLADIAQRAQEAASG